MQKIKKIILIVTMIFSLLFTTSLTAYSSDITVFNAENSIISKWVENGVIKGYPDGTYKMDQLITRSEFAAIICRIFALRAHEGNVVLSDISPLKWYSPAVHQVISKGIMNYDLSDLSYVFYPYKYVSYQEAIDYLSNAYNLKDLKLLENKNSNSLLTRRDLIMLINQITTALINTPCTYSDDIIGNLIINTSNVILKDMTISGNLYLSEGIGDGTITLDNVRISGVVYVNGCGENSLLLTNKTHVTSMVVENHINTVRLIASSENVVKNLVLLSPTILDGPLTLSDTSSSKYAIYPATNAFTANTTPLSHATLVPKIDSTPPITTNPIIDIPNTNDEIVLENNALAPDTHNDNVPENNDTIPDSHDDNAPESTDTTPNPLPVTGESDTSIHAPSNITVDFNNYPTLMVSWDPDPLVSMYSLNITNSNNSISPLILQTTSSIITLDNLPDLLTPNTDYSITITAISNETSATTTKILAFPVFELEELSNGSLLTNIISGDKNTINLENLNLGIYEQHISTHQLLTATPVYTFKFASKKDSYLIDSLIKNDTNYTLKILGTYTPDDPAYNLCSYDATYFANIKYEELTPSYTLGDDESNPITLTSVRHLNNLSSFVANGNPTINKHFKLLNHLDFLNPLQENISSNTNNFIPIGINKDISLSPTAKKSKENKPFAGNFDGGNHIISNMNIYLSQDPSASPDTYIFGGLFAFITGNIKNIILDSSCNITVNSNNNVAGGIVAYASYANSENSISNCYNYASVNGSLYAAGIAGHIYTGDKASSRIVDCYNYGTITSSHAAGIVATLRLANSSTTNVIGCYNWGAVKGKTYAGGIVSESIGAGISNIKYCNNFGDIRTEKAIPFLCIANSGGIISYASNTLHVAYCLNGGNITSNATAIRNQSSPTNTGKLHAGGIVGSLPSIINSVSYSYNFGDISSTLVGIGTTYSGDILANPAESQAITQCYTIFNARSVPDSSQDIFFVSYEEFINSINEILPHLTDYINFSFPSFM